MLSYLSHRCDPHHPDCSGLKGGGVAQHRTGAYSSSTQARSTQPLLTKASTRTLPMPACNEVICNNYSLFYTYNPCHYYPHIVRQPFSLANYASLAIRVVQTLLLRQYQSD